MLLCKKRSYNALYSLSLCCNTYVVVFDVLFISRIPFFYNHKKRVTFYFFCIPLLLLFVLSFRWNYIRILQIVWIYSKKDYILLVSKRSSLYSYSVFLLCINSYNSSSRPLLNLVVHHQEWILYIEFGIYSPCNTHFYKANNRIDSFVLPLSLFS